MVGARTGNRAFAPPTMVIDAIAQLGVVANLNFQSPTLIGSRSFPVAAVETRQGMYKEYTIEKQDDSAVYI